jgi:hypothetical protein
MTGSHRPRGGHGDDDEVTEGVVAPGYQCELFRPPATAQARWRVVRRDGTRLPPVAELGVVIAQASAIAAREGRAWIVGADHHTAEITAGPDGLGVAAGSAPPRWVATVASALRRSSGRSRSDGLSS